jgi:hypothetical protein
MKPERRNRRPSGSTTSTRGIAMAAAAFPLSFPLPQDYWKIAGAKREKCVSVAGVGELTGCGVEPLR